MPTKVQKTSKKVKSAGRRYDNTNRSEKSTQTRKKIIETLVELLVEQRGGEVPIEQIAKRSEITQRTIFRFFKDKKSLHQAMDEYLLSYLQSSTEQMKSRDFVGFAKNVFALFDRHESLTMAYLFSPFGHEARVIFRKKLVQAMIGRIVQERNFSMNPERMKRLALIVTLVNAKIWYDIRSDFGYSGEQIGESIEWALNTLLDQC